jgi:hypothetical protein
LHRALPLVQVTAMKSAQVPHDYEHVSQPVLRWPLFRRRLLRSAGIGTFIVVISLALGMAGYHALVGLSWVDSYENAAMILSGMGPVATPTTTAGKIFSGSYALYCGIAVLVTAGVLFAPLIHRMLHRLHAEQ